MPYKIVQVDGGYKVKKDQRGPSKYFSKSPLTLQGAKRQLKALRIAEAKEEIEKNKKPEQKKPTKKTDKGKCGCGCGCG